MCFKNTIWWSNLNFNIFALQFDVKFRALRLHLIIWAACCWTRFQPKQGMIVRCQIRLFLSILTWDLEDIICREHLEQVLVLLLSFQLFIKCVLSDVLSCLYFLCFLWEKINSPRLSGFVVAKTAVLVLIGNQILTITRCKYIKWL